MASSGLTDREMDLIRGVLKRHGEITGAVMFGSRAKGTASPASDIDLALEGIEDELAADAIAAELKTCHCRIASMSRRWLPSNPKRSERTSIV